MRRNSAHSFRFTLAAFVAALTLISANFSYGQEKTTRSSYEVLSSTPSEIVLHIHPDFRKETVTDPVTGESYTSVTFTGAVFNGLSKGAPAEGFLQLGMLMPSKSAKAVITIISKETEKISATLAPVSTPIHKEGMVVPQYIRDGGQYGVHEPPQLADLTTTSIFRTAYESDVIIHPVQYDFDEGSITLVTDMVIKISLPQSKSIATAGSQKEVSLFHSIFLNGDDVSLYYSAAAEVSRVALRSIQANKNSVQAAEQWLEITTNDEGVYHITASDLTKAGISGADPKTIAIYGYGAQALPEKVDSLTGELRECAIDVRTKGDGSLDEIRFFAPGPAEWHYTQGGGTGKLYGLFHIMNPYSSTGHFLLKAGGVAATKRIALSPDTIGDTVIPIQKTVVQTVVLHEKELQPEHPYISREFVGESISLGRELTIDLPDMPGYLQDSAIIRPGFNSHASKSRTFNLSLNGKALGSILDTPLPGEYNYTTRRWDAELKADASFATPKSLSITATANELSPQLWLNWVEVFYQRDTKLSSGPVSFMLFADAATYQYKFSNAPNAETWDISDPTSVRKLSSAVGSSMDVAVTGLANGLRRFVAFTADQLKNPSMVSTTAPVLRSGVCSSGTQELLITPKAFLEQANKYAAQRRKGGQATEPVSVEVVTVEDIYREFGYGSTDGIAIRDFIRAAVTHSAAAGTTVPMYVLLFGGGHTDYQNRTTSLPVNIPIYETWNDNIYSFRTSEPEYVPDDGFYAELTPNTDRLDIAIGRMVMHTTDDVDALLGKFIKYETSSDQGLWRSKVNFICDDRYVEGGSYDGLTHIYDSENEVANVADRVIIEKIYGQAYPTTYTAVGSRKPEMEQAIVGAFNSGAAIISYVGHGNPSVWTHESVLTVPSTINKLTNLNHLPFLTTATCDYSQFDDYAAKTSGGVQMFIKPDGGAIGLLGTSRSVQGGDSFAPEFYKSLFNTPCDQKTGTTPVGIAYLAGRKVGWSYNVDKYFIMGDPAQRVLIPRQYVAIDSINGNPYDAQANTPITISAMSLMTISGHIANTCDGGEFDASFNGLTNITLYDAPATTQALSTFPDHSPVTDIWRTNGPILYSGVASVSGGRFTTSFVVSKDIKYDSALAKISLLAYSDDNRSALGDAENVRVFGIDTSRVNADVSGPKLTVYIGSRAFHSGDLVPVHSTIIVDVEDLSGLNTSTSGIGHSFIGWTDDSTAGAVDLSQHYVAEPNDFTRGTTMQDAQFPLGKHLLRVRAFDAAGNPAFGEVEFIAKSDDPYQLYDVTIVPHPISTTATFTFQQPASPDSPVDVTLDLYNAIGQHLRAIEVSSISSNTVTIPFDGKDDGGNSLLDGMYVYRLTATQRLSGISTISGGTFLVVHQQ